MDDQYGREPPKVLKILSHRAIDREAAFDAVHALLHQQHYVDQALKEDVRQVAEALASEHNKRKIKELVPGNSNEPEGAEDALSGETIPLHDERPAPPKKLKPQTPDDSHSSDAASSREKKLNKSERKAAKKAKKEAKKAKKEAKKRKRQSEG